MTADEFMAQYRAMQAQGILPANSSIQTTNQYGDILDAQNAPPPQSQGWLADLIGGVVNPFVNLGKIGLEGLSKGVSILGGTPIDKYKPIFMTPSEYYGVQEHPVQTALGAGATLGSLLVPGGTGVGGMALQGLKAGGLFSGGQQLMSNKNDLASVLQSAGTGALTGGVLGGALGIGGKVVNKFLGKAGKESNITPQDLQSRLWKTENKGLLKTENTTPQIYTVKDYANMPILERKGTKMTFDALGQRAYGAKEGIETVPNLYQDYANIDNAMKWTDMPGGSTIGRRTQANYDQLPERLGNLIDQNVQQMSNFKPRVTTFDTLVNDATNKLVKEGMDRNVASAQIGKIAREGMGGLPFIEDKVLNSGDLLQIARTQAIKEGKMDFFAQKFGQKVEYANPIKQARVEAAMTLDNLIKEKLDTVGNEFRNAQLKGATGIAREQILAQPTIKQINDVFRTLYKNANSYANVINGEALGATMSGKLNIIKPFAAEINTGAGRGLIATSNLLSGKGGDISGVRGILSGIRNAPTPTIAWKPIPAGLTGVLGGALNSTQTAQTAQTNQPALNNTKTTMPTNTLQGGLNPGFSQMSSGQDEIIKMLAAGIKPSDVKTIASMLGLIGGTGKQLTTAAAEKVTDTQTSLSYLDQLESAVNGSAGRFGLLQGGALGNIVQGLGLDPGRAYIQSQINTIAQVIGKALEGGKLTDQDIVRYREMLPTLSDTPDNAIQKINSLRALLKSRLSSQVTGYQNAGYSAQDMLDALNSAGTQ